MLLRLSTCVSKIGSTQNLCVLRKLFVQTLHKNIQIMGVKSCRNVWVVVIIYFLNVICLMNSELRTWLSSSSSCRHFGNSLCENSDSFSEKSVLFYIFLFLFYLFFVPMRVSVLEIRVCLCVGLKIYQCVFYFVLMNYDLFLHLSGMYYQVQARGKNLKSHPG